jgi:hypothetical protein
MTNFCLVYLLLRRQDRRLLWRLRHNSSESYLNFYNVFIMSDITVFFFSLAQHYNAGQNPVITDVSASQTMTNSSR